MVQPVATLIVKYPRNLSSPIPFPIDSTANAFLSLCFGAGSVLELSLGVSLLLSKEVTDLLVDSNLLSSTADNSELCLPTSLCCCLRLIIAGQIASLLQLQDECLTSHLYIMKMLRPSTTTTTTR
jgi:hypothetical protein